MKSLKKWEEEVKQGAAFDFDRDVAPMHHCRDEHERDDLWLELEMSKLSKGKDYAEIAGKRFVTVLADDLLNALADGRRVMRMGRKREEERPGFAEFPNPFD